MNAPLIALPSQPNGVPWPTSEWPKGEVPAGVDLNTLLDRVCDNDSPLAETYAVVVIHEGKLIAERYQGALPSFTHPPTPVTVETPLLSWSMAKSMLQATVGMLVGDGKLVVDALADVPEWSSREDPRHAITLGDLLAMRDGLDFAEDYVDERISDVMQMLFGEGQSDVAHFAADRPLAAPPGTRFSYSSGTTNIISSIVARQLGHGEPYKRFLQERLFDPIGMTTAVAGFDDAGTWVASTTVHAIARDYARFGLLYLRDGMWDGKRILPEGWVDYARTIQSIDPKDGPYGAHWWGVADDAFGTFRASGFEGQSIMICPALDLIVVRLGKTPTERNEHLVAWRAEVVQAFA